MMAGSHLSIALRPTTGALPLAGAWLPRAETAEWLLEVRKVVDALRTSRVASINEIALYVTPRSPRDRSAGGLLIVLPRNVPLTADPFSPSTVALGWGAPGVLIPRQSRLSPSLLAEEVSKLFPYHLHYFHPTEGVFAFEEGDRITASDLLSIPEVSKTDWNAAVPPPPPVPRLKRLELHIPGSFEDLVQGLAGEIGEAKDELKPNDGPIKKAGQFLSALGAGLAGGMAAGLGKLFGKKAAGGANWMDQIAQWGAEKWNDLHNIRKRELDRLLEMFERNPQEALRHALPLAGDAPRGAAPPSTKLGPRDTRLNVGKGHGGPADHWNIDPSTRQSLERRYREAAQRALAEKQFERAAYIFGELLGDWANAAAALAKGGRARDAARIYLERLSNKHLAAQCLAHAGLLWEAIELYRELKMHELAGDLLTRLGRDEDALAEYRLAVAATGNRLEKARLLEKKCRSSEEALATLNEGWPLTAQAPECLQEHLALLGRLERYSVAAEIIRKLDLAPFQQPLKLLDAMLEVAWRFPHPSVRSEVEPVAIAIVGRELSAGKVSDFERQQLLQRLPKFAPQDRLLERDAQRFNSRRQKPQTPIRHQSLLAPVATHDLSRGRGHGGEWAWHSLSWGAERLSIAGLKDGRLIVGSTTDLSTPRVSEQSFPPLPGGSSGIRHVIVGESGGSVARAFYSGTVRKAYFHALSGVPFPHSEEIGALRDVLAITASGKNEWALARVAETDSILAEFYDPSARQLRQVLIDYGGASLPRTIQLAARRRSLWIGVENSLCWHPEDGVFKITGLDSAATALSIAPEPFSEQVLVTAGDQVTLVGVVDRKKRDLEAVNLFGGTSAQAAACFTNDGNAVVLNQDGGLLYEVQSKVRETARIVWPPKNGRPIAIAPFGDHGFAVLAENNTLLIYRA